MGVLKEADLTTLTSKSVRKEIEKKLGFDLTDRRKEIDAIIMAAISDSDKSSKKRKATDDGAAEPKKEKKATGFGKSVKLSPELAAVVGGDCMPRHEVVKKLWAHIKSNNLQDPKQKQFAI